MDLLRLLDFPKNTLRDFERGAVEKWLRTLSGADIENVAIFLGETFKFFRQMSRTNRSDYYVMNAVGSTIEGKRDYGDIDFLLLTNGSLPGFNGAYNDQLQEMLSASYYIGEACTFVEDEYNENPETMPGRDTLRITPTMGEKSDWKKIHMILQRGIPSEEEWQRKDRYRRVPLFRIGNLF